MERERISLSEALKLTLPEPPYLSQIMVAYLKFWWKYERSDPEEMWKKISRIGFDDSYREASTTSWNACERACRSDASGRKPSRPKPKPEDERPGLLPGTS